MKELLGSRERTDSLQALMEAPFKPKHRLWKSGYPRTRFSDGTFPVGYFSLEAGTARAEVHHWLCSEFIGKPSKGRKAWYSRFTCDFNGDAKDIRSMREAWPDLTHTSNYTFCNGLGAEAVAEGLEGPVAPSARKPGGTNVPVFAKRALSNPRKHSFVELKCSASNATIKGRRQNSSARPDSDFRNSHNFRCTLHWSPSEFLMAWKGTQRTAQPWPF